MSVRLHADDLGLHPAVDRAIFRLFEAGAIASASLLVTGDSASDAARAARSLGLPVALHLAIVDTAALSPPSEVPSLVGSDGRFARHYGHVLTRYVLGRIRAEELALEIRRQVEAFARSGLIGGAGLVVDGHQHLHLLPGVFGVLLELAAEYQIRAFRVPLMSRFERRERTLRGLGFRFGERLGGLAVRRAARHGLQPLPCWAALYAGRLTFERARGVLESLPATAQGQLLCHPGDDNAALGLQRGWGFDWETELATAFALEGAARSP